MHHRSTIRHSRLALIAAFSLGLPEVARAVDGVVELNQARALSGSVTPGDTPGFPITLSQSGSYRLTGNLVLSDPNPGAIAITSANVTVDLGGFAILGPNSFSLGGSCTAAGVGIGIRADATSDLRAVTVRNGQVRGMGGAGVYLPAPGARVEQVIADQNCGHGFDLGDSALVIHSQAFSNAGTGIHAGLGSSVTGNSARANDSDGIQVAGDSAVTGNTAYDNGVSGIVGFGAGSVVTGNTMSHNGLWGLTGNLGYGENVLTCNHNACDNAAQVSGGLEIGANLCGTDTTCP